jgi:hypothetical protein
MRDLMKILMFLIFSPFLSASFTLAIINDIPTSLNTTEDLLRFSEISREAGTAQVGGLLATYEYGSNQIEFAEYCREITNANKLIRNYNLMLERFFNKTISSRMRIKEFSP